MEAVEKNSFSSLKGLDQTRKYSNQNENIKKPNMTPSGNISGHQSSKFCPDGKNQNDQINIYSDEGDEEEKGKSDSGKVLKERGQSAPAKFSNLSGDKASIFKK